MKSFFKLVEMTLALDYLALACQNRKPLKTTFFAPCILDFFGGLVILLLPFTFDWSWIRRPNLAIASLSNKDGGGYENATL